MSQILERWSSEAWQIDKVFWPWQLTAFLLQCHRCRRSTPVYAASKKDRRTSKQRKSGATPLTTKIRWSSLHLATTVAILPANEAIRDQVHLFITAFGRLAKFGNNVVQTEKLSARFGNYTRILHLLVILRLALGLGCIETHAWLLQIPSTFSALRSKDAFKTI